MQLTTWQEDNTMNKFQHVGTLKQVFLYTCGHTYSMCQLYYQRVIHKYKCLSSFFFFLLSLNWEREREREREYVIAVLSFLTGSFGEYFLFYKLAGFFIALARRLQFFLSKILFRFFTRSLGMRLAPSVHGDIYLQNWYSLSLFPLTKKGATSA